ncbi:alpha/beta fold hydrolase [Flavobacterium sp. 7A]|uniref:alpha/beta fold hydrolase n=1 Tax=Flavobacterium sp. 7A TaxID=2940571 RepID=UPI002226F646|nr:alpha/beta hydrolase [Flavobacterium sp. 7A]MCW2118069.1 pimeloyl-ACP methyl ester carboxylesterase [Flavobacterium sp. 7A]
MKTENKTITIDGVEIFYREAGNPTSPTILLLHGFPSSSHMYRKVLEDLSNEYHLIAPDYPGFGFSAVPSPSDYDYTFDNFAKTITAFTTALQLPSYYLMMQDYGGPVGLRIATAHPEKIKGLLIQNANTYLEGLGEYPQKMGQLVAAQDFQELSNFKDYLLSPEGIKDLYLDGAEDPSKIDPISYQLDTEILENSLVKEVQTLLFNDYGNNFPKYPEWQKYLRLNQPPTLVIWGENDKFFSKTGGLAYSNDLKNPETHFFNGGHFVLEEYADEAIILIRDFIKRNK